jgi:hypothetical protein
MNNPKPMNHFSQRFTVSAGANVSLVAAQLARFIRQTDLPFGTQVKVEFACDYSDVQDGPQIRLPGEGLSEEDLRAFLDLEVGDLSIQ